MKIIYLAAGLLALALGAVGVVLPILPSTPFLLLAAFCFARSSERLNDWFKSTRLYKNNLESFVRGQGMTWAAKLKIIASVTVVMGIAFFFMKGTNIGRICLAVVWAAHVIVLCFIVKTCPPEIDGSATDEEASAGIIPSGGAGTADGMAAGALVNETGISAPGNDGGKRL